MPRFRVGSDGVLDTEVYETPPTDDSKNNPSYVLSYDGDNQLTGIAMTISGTTYNRTITWTGNVATEVSVWTEA